jgi:hypothetical protein
MRILDRRSSAPHDPLSHDHHHSNRPRHVDRCPQLRIHVVILVACKERIRRAYQDPHPNFTRSEPSETHGQRLHLVHPCLIKRYRRPRWHRIRIRLSGRGRFLLAHRQPVCWMGLLRVYAGRGPARLLCVGRSLLECRSARRLYPENDSFATVMRNCSDTYLAAAY